jgi:enamine deaminase RidA (YjgF/YER057c/UK114 family)
MWQVQDITSKLISPAARYKLGRKAGPLLFLAGQIAADPTTQKIVKGYMDLPEEDRKQVMSGSMNRDFVEGPLCAQAYFILKNIKGILEEQGSSLDNILYVTTYILNMDWFPGLERVRDLFFGDNYPPGTILEVPRLGLSTDILIEIEIVAVVPES